jgi:putative tricarboxylic transport membrane protein
MGKSILRDGDAISGAVLAALGVYIFLQARQWDYMTPDGPGPGFFPVWYGIAMIGLSLALIASRIRRATSPGPIDWRRIARALGAWLGFAISVVLMEPLGFLVSFALLTFVMVMVVFGRSPVTAAATALAAALGFYVIFPLVLGLSLPTGLFGF